jgi:hypothetical protein
MLEGLSSPLAETSEEKWVHVGDGVEVSNFGGVRGGRTETTHAGYKLVWIGGRRRPIHRLVLSAFCGYGGKNMECNHIDRDPGNNRLSNLEWVTHKENQQLAARDGWWKKKQPAVSDEMIEYIINKDDWKYGEKKRLAEELGITPRYLSYIAKQERREGAIGRITGDGPFEDPRRK